MFLFRSHESLFAGGPQEGSFIIPGMMKVTARKGEQARHCRVRITIDEVGNYWTLLVLQTLANGSQRYMEIRRAIRTVSQRSLTQALRDLERDGYVQRTVYPTSPPKVSYELTPLGKSFWKAATGLVHWADMHLAKVIAARKAYDTANNAA
jgi:DNA-binding HxlR family transcriptional regulator